MVRTVGGDRHGRAAKGLKETVEKENESFKDNGCNLTCWEGFDLRGWESRQETWWRWPGGGVGCWAGGGGGAGGW